MIETLPQRNKSLTTVCLSREASAYNKVRHQELLGPGGLALLVGSELLTTGGIQVEAE